MPLGKAAKYGYLSARCRTLRSKLMDRETMRHLTASRSIGELSSALSSTLYAPFITTVSSEGIHQGLTEAFERQRSRLLSELSIREKAVFELFFVSKYLVRLPLSQEKIYCHHILVLYSPLPRLQNHFYDSV